MTLNLKGKSQRNFSTTSSVARKGFYDVLLPADATGFDCYFVNVTAPDIAPASTQVLTPDFTSQLQSGASSCSYPGIYTRTPLLASTTAGAIQANLTVPIGANRLIQVIGVVDPGNKCNALSNDIIQSFQGSSSTGFGLFELGRELISNITAAQEISITNAYDSANPRRVDCNNTSAVTGPAPTSIPIQTLLSSSTWKTDCLTQSLSFPSIGAIQSEFTQLTYDSAGSLTVDIYSFSDTACTNPGALFSQTTYTGYVPTYTLTQKDEYDVAYTSGTVTLKVTSPALPSFNSVCSLSLANTNTFVDVTGQSTNCRFYPASQPTIDKLIVGTTTGSIAKLNFGNTVPIGNLPGPSGGTVINLLRTYFAQ